MQEKLAELRASYKERGWPDIKVGLGLSSGDMTVGDMGSKIRKAYTVMGDNVNLGSRLEGATRQYGVWILVSEATKNISEGILFRAIDMVRVKGKNVPIRIFEPIGVESELSAEKKEQITKWNDMFALYQKQAWDEAQAILDQLLAIEPEFKLYNVFAERIAFFKSNPPGADWDGVTKFETK
jgi:adenylate cyclase